MGAVRVSGADGRTWQVGRRWLPWRPRLHSPLADGPWLFPRVAEFAAEAGAALVVALAILLLPVVVVVGLITLEWLALLSLLPVLALIRLALPVPWPVLATGHDRQGNRVRYVASVRGWAASGRLAAAVAGELRAVGEPRSLTLLSVEPPPARTGSQPSPDTQAGGRPAPVGPGTATPAAGASTARPDRQVCPAVVHGLDSPFAVGGWLGGYLVVEPGRMALSQDPAGGTWGRREIPVDLSGDVSIGPALPDERRRVGRRTVARFTGTNGRPYRVAVLPESWHVLDAGLRRGPGGTGS